MIIEKLQSANSVILDSVNAANNKHAAEMFKNQLLSLNTLSTQLEQLLNIINAIQEKGIASHIVTGELKETLQNAVDSCGQKTIDHSLDAGTVLALKNAINLCRSAVNTIWRDSANKTCTPVIESLKSLKGILGETREAELIIDELERAKTNTPTSVNALDKYISNVNRGKQIVEEMHFDSDQEVKLFIEKVRSQRATISNLTPHVLEWLEKNHLSNKIKLRF